MVPIAVILVPFPRAAVEGFLDKLDLRDVTLAGVSIGGSIALIVAARQSAKKQFAAASNTKHARA